MIIQCFHYIVWSSTLGGRFTVLCNALCIAIINKIAGSIRQLFVDTACFFLYYVHLIPVPELLADGLKIINTPLVNSVAEYEMCR